MISLGLPAGRWGILVKGPGTRTRMKVWSFGGIRLRVGNATEEAVTASVLGRGDVKRDGQEHAKYDKGKDPLQGNDLDSDLSEGEC
jgi:hypothetical protein